MLGLLSQSFWHDNQHKISSDDVTNDDVIHILDIKFLFSGKKMCRLKELDKRSSTPKTVPCYLKRCSSYGSLKKKLLTPRTTILFFKNQTPWYFFSSFCPRKLIFCWNRVFSVSKNRMILEFSFSTLEQQNKWWKYWWRHILWRHKSSFVAVSVIEKSFILFFCMLFVLVMKQNQSAT